MILIRTPHGEQDLDLAEFEARVQRGEIPPDTPVCFPVITGEAFVPARDLEIFRGLYSPDRIYFRRYFNLSRFPWITTAVILANVAVFVAMRLGGGDADATALMVRFGAKSAVLIDDLGETWRFLSANFVHRDVLHIAFNLFFLFNVGGALENAYRPLDYLLILVASALGTTTLSYLGSDAVSAGASGIVFGCFGGVVAFGLKYRDIIPSQYRRFFGGSVAPYVLVFLWIGWMSTGIDNWGHLGGLVAGTAATLLARPRLLEGARGPAGRLVRGGALALLTVGVVAVGPLWSAAALRLVPEHDDETGLVVAHPEGWRRAITHLGEIGFSNLPEDLHEKVSLQIRAEQRPAPVDLAALAEDWFDVELLDLEHAGRIRRVRRQAARPTEIAGRPALEYLAAFEAVDSGREAVPFLLRLLVFSRGSDAFTLVLLAPAQRAEAYRGLFDRLVASVRLLEPAYLRTARAAVLLWPLDPDPHLRLGDAWGRLGDTKRAEAALREAVRLSPGDPAPHLALARLLFASKGRRAEGRAVLEEALRLAPGQAEPFALLADYREAGGDLAGARSALEEAVRREPGDRHLARRLEDLRARLGAAR